MKPIFHDLTNPVTAAVLPLKGQAISRAETETHKLVERYAAKLAEHGDDIRAAFPYPKSMYHDRVQYRKLKASHDIAHRITKDKPGSRYHGSMRDPHYRVIDPEQVEKFVQNARDFAAQQYDAFVMKLVGKVGPVTEAKLHGTHVWGYSDLSVRKPDGSVEIWRTQQIVNQSVLGTIFNQWPTRKIGKGAYK
jgi:hypothetical protein